ncbi:hypothetical protein RDI58_010401 [Solanum bulbocastanum]|uniref:Protein phosphatase n=1 Tax=Solanum bulbocastanum TaxID=147425 RepID=A0AAN8YFZ5_SOLBU
MEVLNKAYFKEKYQVWLVACISTLTCDIVHVVNIVDRRVVIRDGVIVYKSEIQQKGFNYPIQSRNGVKFDDISVAQEIEVTNSESKSIYTPFAIDCLKVGKDRVSGKRDNITVIVARILPR